MKIMKSKKTYIMKDKKDWGTLWDWGRLQTWQIHVDPELDFKTDISGENGTLVSIVYQG